MTDERQPDAAETSAASERVNPYASQAAVVEDEPTRAPPEFGNLDIWEVLAQSRQRINDHLVTFAVLASGQLLVLVASFGLLISAGILSGHASGHKTLGNDYFAVGWGALLVMLMLIAWLYTGIVRVALKVAREQPVNYLVALEVDYATVQVFFLTLPIYGLHLAIWLCVDTAHEQTIQTIGLACDVPILLAFALAPQFIIDRKMPFWDAIKESAKRTLWNCLSLALMALLEFAFLLLLLPFTLGLSLQFLMPVAGMASTIVYLQTTRERLAPRFALGDCK